MAADEIAGWDNDRSYGQFDKFKRWHLRNNVWSADWPLSWRNWVERGKDWDAKESKADKRPTKGFAGAIVGIQDWLDRQNAKKSSG
jgi:hypothetical protein